MTYDRDYILRMVREFAQFLARVVKKGDGTAEGRSVSDLDGAARTFVGLGIDALRSLPTDQLTMMLSIGGTLDVNRAYAAGRLLESSSELASDPAVAADGARKATHLLSDAALAFGGYLNEEHEAALRRLEDRLLAQEDGPLASEPRLLAKVLDLRLRHGDADRVRHVAAALALRTEADEPMTAVRVALRGAAPEVLGRVQSCLESAPDSVPGEAGS